MLNTMMVHNDYTYYQIITTKMEEIKYYSSLLSNLEKYITKGNNVPYVVIVVHIRIIVINS